MDWFPLRTSFHAANPLVFTVRGKTFFQSVNRHIATVDFWLGRRRYCLHRYPKLYGAFIKCAKANRTDVREENTLAFAEMHCRLVR